MTTFADLPANSSPTPTEYEPSPLTGPGSLAERATITITLDTDMVMAVEDQAQSTGLSFQDWCQANLNDALRSYLGG